MNRKRRTRAPVMFATPVALLAMFLTLPALAQQPKTEQKEFSIRPVAPPAPALKYTLMFPPEERTHGNAAIPYMQATMLLPPEAAELQDKCFDARDAGDEPRFKALSEELAGMTGGAVDLVDVGARREACDWAPAIRERGVAALLPHLNEMRVLANVLQIRAVAQARDGKPDEAIATLRLGYELSHKVGQEPVLVSGLVATGIQRQMGVALAELMSRPDCPNLYWALASLPRPMVSLRDSMAGERTFIDGSIPGLLRVRRGEELSAEDWRVALKRLDSLTAQAGPASQPVAVKVLTEPLPGARERYVKLHDVSPEQVQKIDVVEVNGEYLFAQYLESMDDVFKLLSMPYGQMVEQMRALEQRHADAREPNVNPFLVLIPSLSRAAESFARADRELAALTTVEAIRSYAAANGKLPDRLEDMVDTPAPKNPWTDEAFEYALDKDACIVRDTHDPQRALEYTVRLKR